MGEVVNLGRARKAKARATREVEAAANRAKFGRTKAQRAADQVEAARIANTLLGARLDDDTHRK